MFRLFATLLFAVLILHCTPPKKMGARPVPHHATKPVTSHTTAAPIQPLDLPVKSTADNVAWLDSERLMPVLEEAQRRKKPVFVELYASWCAPCKAMEEDIFTQVPTFQYLNANFLNFRTDFDLESGKTIAAIYEVTSLPAVLFLDPQGVVLARHTGMANPSVLKSLGDAALLKMK